ncbi:hypothetical protein BJ138DRAFT_351648 [Hygrophoropsis aurantiaca]|uniref:Uncharacterized protein n=1 Tax=Hygrophoropsis aurantiaca TaxID=72124 RepID=A0ACB8A5A6_9AGAM|nr:hypothetical protein BJ138DRAFT_351648 [Hygrophoropsis aurantiaca]
MSRPPVFPDQSASGIAVDPRTLERVIPESKRPDGSVRKQLKVRPGFTPQEDVSRFRGTKQAQMDARALPKGHILGWVAPAGAAMTPTKPGAPPPPNKNAKKRQNQRARKAAQKEEIRDNWEDEDEDESVVGKSRTEKATSEKSADKPNLDAPPETIADTHKPQDTDALASKLGKLDVK